MSIFGGGGYCKAGLDPHSTGSDHYTSIPSDIYTRRFRSHLCYLLIQALVPGLHRGSNNNRTSKV